MKRPTRKELEMRLEKALDERDVVKIVLLDHELSKSKIKENQKKKDRA